MNVNHFFLGSLSLLLFACGSKDKGNSDESPKNSAPIATTPLGLKSQSEDPTLLASWQSNCSVANGKSYLTNLEFKPDFLIYKTTWYNDLFCRSENLSFRFFSEYRAEGGKLYAQLAEAHIKIENEGIRDAAEKSKSCGFDLWLAGTWHNVTGQTCEKTEKTGGVWTTWTMPRTVIMNQFYEVSDNKLTIFYSNSSTEFTKQ